FVVGLDDDVFPHKNSTTQNSVAEERRLFYVALTRAKEQLFLSHTLSKAIGPERSMVKASRCLSELPKSVYQTENENAQTQQLSEDERRERTRSRLSGLRKSLAADQA